MKQNSKLKVIFRFSICMPKWHFNKSSTVHLKRAPVAQLVECPLQETGGHGFDPGLQRTKVIKMTTPSHIILTLDRPVLALPHKCQARSS